MKKLLAIMAVASMGALAPIAATAKQTVEQVQDSIQSILAEARKGDPAMQNEVGKWYYQGRHQLDKNFETAAKWWARAAQQNYPDAIGNLARCYQLGHGVTADSARASQLYIASFKRGNTELFEKLEAKAKEGDVFAAMLMAECYANKVPPTTDKAGAIPYLEIAANKGHVGAMRKLGMHYMNTQHAIKAAPWFKKGAEANDTVCTYWYGYQLLNGKGVKPDHTQGAIYMLKAAESGMANAMLTVGQCYLEGKGLTENHEQALLWFKRAAGAAAAQPKVRPEAEWTVAECYREGTGTPVNFDAALTWYAAASANGLAARFNKLVADSIADSTFVTYLEGMKAYTDGDYDAAMTAFKAVEKAGYPDGSVMIAAVTLNKDYKKYDLKKGVKLLTKAAETNPQAMYMMAKLYERGEGVEKNMTEAVNYMTRAAEAGYGKAMCALADMYYEGRGTPQSYAKAVEWYSKADTVGLLSADAAKRYASCYENGWGGLDADKAKADAILKVKRGPFVTALLKKF